MPKVYVPQQPSRYDSTVSLWVPTMNLDPAKKHGALIIMFPPEGNRLSTGPLVAAMKHAMRDYSHDDFIVAVGDPSLIAAAACIACRATKGLLRMLKWDRMTSDYVTVEMTI